MRAEVLRVLHTLTLGAPVLSADDLNDAPLTSAEVGLAFAAGNEELALLNAVLEVEAELRATEFAALERLLVLAQFTEGALDNRLLELPPLAFARAAADLYVLGWVDAA
jgi:hypothetical protein